MPLDPDLRDAYSAAHYVVYGEPELVVRIGELSPDLDALMEAEGAMTAAFITADNPYGLTVDENTNLVAHAALGQALEEIGCAAYRGEGRDPTGERPPEATMLAVGLDLDSAIALGKRMEQNAIVFIEKGKAPELVELV